MLNSLGYLSQTPSLLGYVVVIIVVALIGRHITRLPGREMSARLLLLGALGGLVLAYVNRPALFGGVMPLPLEDWVRLMPTQILGYIVIGGIVGWFAGFCLDQRKRF